MGRTLITLDISKDDDSIDKKFVAYALSITKLALLILLGFVLSGCLEEGPVSDYATKKLSVNHGFNLSALDKDSSLDSYDKAFIDNLSRIPESSRSEVRDVIDKIVEDGKISDEELAFASLSAENPENLKITRELLTKNLTLQIEKKYSSNPELVKKVFKLIQPNKYSSLSADSFSFLEKFFGNNVTEQYLDKVIAKGYIDWKNEDKKLDLYLQISKNSYFSADTYIFLLELDWIKDGLSPSDLSYINALPIAFDLNDKTKDSDGGGLEDIWEVKYQGNINSGEDDLKILIKNEFLNKGIEDIIKNFKKLSLAGNPSTPVQYKGYNPPGFLEYDYNNFYVETYNIHQRKVTIAWAKDVAISETKRKEINDFIFTKFIEWWEVFGGFPWSTYTIVFKNEPKYAGGEQGIGYEANAVNYIQENYHERIAHEVFHAWTNAISDVDEGKYEDALWYREGITQYYGDRGAGRSLYQLWMSEHWRWYANEIKGTKYDVPLVDMPAKAKEESGETNRFGNPYRKNVYWKGALVAYMLDIELSKTNNTIDDFLKYLYKNYALSDNRPKNSDMLIALNTVSGKDFTEFFNRYIYGTEPLPLNGTFQFIEH